MRWQPTGGLNSRMSTIGSVLRTAYRQKATSRTAPIASGTTTSRWPNPAAAPGVGQAEDERRGAGREQREPEDVQLRLDRGHGVLGQVLGRQKQGR